MPDIFALTKKIFSITELLWTIGIFLVLFFASVVGGDPFRIRCAGKIGFRLAVAFAKSNLA
ncbi:hypothetical protein FY140_21485 [Agrobacterium tumefaciens]|uniref:hypothetical protein n=1 Tax=Agrobacterium tumefaciens TaxID=358 RepID=UPI0021D0463E|nr:hypothetical protein [Agrobacterium tumefaciens]UXT23253.1 hypothetical protein FY140_21485 [Agrobacterium tumefaciens]